MSVWRNRDFCLVWGGGLVNNIGDWLLVVALPAFVYTETRSGAATATIVVIELTAGILCGPYGGSLADRWDLRKVVVATNVLQAVALVPLLTVTADRIWPAFVVAGLQGLLQEVNNPASFALVPRIVPDEQLVQANSANAASDAIARLAGSPLGGIAVAFGGLTTVVAADAITFITVAVATTFVRTPTGSLAASDTEAGRKRVRVRDGWAEIRRHAGLTGYLGVEALVGLAFAMFPVLFIAFVVDVLDGDEATVGIIRGMSAFGGITASVLVGRFAKDLDPIKLMIGGYAGLGAVAFVFVNMPVVTTALWVYLMLFALTGLPNITSQVGATTTAQRLCPPEVLGRLRGMVAAVTAIGSLIGTIGAGLLVDVVDVQVLFNVQAALFVASGVAAYWAILQRRPVAAVRPAQ